MLNISEVFSNLLGLFLLIGVGWGMVRQGILPADASRLFSRLLMGVTLPATIFTSMIRPYDPDFLRDGLRIVSIGLVLILLFFGISALLLRPFRVTQGRRGVWMLSCALCNNGFMGFPICLALFGDEGLSLAAFLGIPFNLYAYTLGPKLIQMDHSAGRKAPPLPWRSILCTPVNLSVILGILCYAARLSIPEALALPLGYLADVTTPLSMIVIGMNLSGQRVRSILQDRDVRTNALLRLLILPLLSWLLLFRLPIRPLVLGVTVITMAMPAPAITSILSETYGGDTKFASETVFLSSLLCLATIPAISLLL